MTSPLTLGRQAVWNAINQWDRLRVDGKSVFKRQFKFEDEGAFQTAEDIAETLGAGDLPALAILPDVTGIVPKLQTLQEWYFDLRLLMWTKDFNLLSAEKYAPELINAAYAGTPAGGSLSFVKNPTTGTGYDPISVPVFKFALALVGGNNQIKTVQTEITLRLRIQFSPFEQ